MAVRKPVNSNQDTVLLDLPTDGPEGFRWTAGAQLLVNRVLQQDTYDDNAINDIANWLYQYCEGQVERLDGLAEMLTERTNLLSEGLTTLTGVIEGVEQLGNYAGGWDQWTDLPAKVDANGKITPPKTGISVQLSTNDFVTVRVNNNPAHTASSATAIEKASYNKQVRYVVTQIASNRDITWSFDIKYDTDVTYLEEMIEALQEEVAAIHGDISQIQTALTGKMDKLPMPDGGKIVISQSNGNVEESSFTFETIDKRISCRVSGLFNPAVIGSTVNVAFGPENEVLCSKFKLGETILFDSKGVEAIVTVVSTSNPSVINVTGVIVATSGFDDIPDEGEKEYVRVRDSNGNTGWKDFADVDLITDHYVKKIGDVMAPVAGSSGDLSFKDAPNSGTTNLVVGHDGTVESPKSSTSIDFNSSAQGHVISVDAQKTIFKSTGISQTIDVEPTGWIYFKQSSNIQEGDKRFGQSGTALVRQTYLGGTWVTYGSDASESEWEVLPLLNS